MCIVARSMYSRHLISCGGLLPLIPSGVRHLQTADLQTCRLADFCDVDKPCDTGEQDFAMRRT